MTNDRKDWIAEKHNNWRQRSQNCIAQGALTNSKRPQSFVDGVYPTHLVRGQGCHVWDTNGKRYVDFICALGTNLLGYARREIGLAVHQRIDMGNLLSLSASAEVEFGELILNYLPFVERIKVLKSGSEGCSAAVRIARAFTGRYEVYSTGYHGWHDEMVSLTPPAHGIPSFDWIYNYADPDNLGGAAAVIIEPVILDFSPERITWLATLREKCTKVGALLIFDETITGLRFPGLSVAKWSGVYPDLIVMGKALGNGLPISIVGGRKEVMDCDYFVSSSFAGDLLPMAAATMALPMMTDRIDDMWVVAGRFQEQFNEAMTAVVAIKGYPTRGVLEGDELMVALFMQEACKAGLLFGASFFWCEPHAAEMHRVLETCRIVATKIKSGSAKLEGAMPRKAFAQIVREKT